MARKWLQSVDVEVDATGRPAFEKALTPLAAGHAGHMQATVSSANASGGAAFGVAESGKKIAITDLLISADAADLTVTLKDADDKVLAGPFYPAEHGGLTHAFRSPICITTVNKDAKLVTNAAGQIAATLSGYYYE